MSRVALFLAAWIGLSASASAAGVVVPAEDRQHPFYGGVPACDSARMIAEVEQGFANKESEFWSSELRIDAIVDIREIGWRANSVAYIPRRYCVGVARLSDHHDRKVVYELKDSLGFAGYMTGVDFCVVGYDRNFAYAPACSVLRPYVDRFAKDVIQLTYPWSSGQSISK